MEVLVLDLEVALEEVLAVLGFPVLEQIFLILEREEVEHRKLYYTIVSKAFKYVLRNIILF